MLSAALTSILHIIFIQAEDGIRYYKVTGVQSFVFQAEDGIRDYKVTGVRTCALPILPAPKAVNFTAQRNCPSAQPDMPGARVFGVVMGTDAEPNVAWLERPVPVTSELLAKTGARSEERRVGEEGRSRWSPYQLKKKAE